MHTHKILNKLSSITLLSLYMLIGASIYSYGAESIKKVSVNGSHKTDESMLFTFMRYNYKLEGYAAATGVDVTKGDDEVLASIPYRDLYHKLQNKLLNLAVEEAKTAISKNDITEEMQKVMTAIITEAGGGFDRAMLAFREKFKNYPNTADLVSLTATSINDAKEIFELSTVSADGTSTEKKASKELLEMIYGDTIDSYKTFVAHNEGALKIIANLVDEEFKFDDITVNCKPFKGRELCETEKSIKEIKKFSEIMPYVIKIQEEQREKDPSVSFIPNSDF